MTGVLFNITFGADEEGWDIDIVSAVPLPEPKRRAQRDKKNSRGVPLPVDATGAPLPDSGLPWRCDPPGAEVVPYIE